MDIKIPRHLHDFLVIKLKWGNEEKEKENKDGREKEREVKVNINYVLPMYKEPHNQFMPPHNDHLIW